MSRVQLEISLGIILVLITASVLVYIGVNENNRMARFVDEQNALAVEVGADLFDTNCKSCHGVKGEGTPGLCPPLNDKHFFNGRLKEVGWSGSLEDYIVATVSSGRLVSTRPDQYPGGGKPAMPAWSDHYGGPLRDDQIRNIAAFITNWESTAGEVTTSTVTVEGVGTDITVKLPAGDVQRGDQLAQSKGCAACHITTAVGPAWAKTADTPGIGERAATRIKDPNYTGKATTPEQYLFESIVNPHVYLVPNFGPVMPNTFGQSLTAQEVADLIAYMLTIK
jgi:mono/diheme cytochrome c family protein